MDKYRINISNIIVIMNNITITIIFILITLTIKKTYNNYIEEHFIVGVLSALPNLIKAIVSFFTNFVDLFMVLVDAILNFVMSIVDLVLILVGALEWIGNVPNWIATFGMNIVNIFLDLLTIIVMWLNPISLIRGIIKLIVFMVKLFLVMMLDTIVHLFRMASSSFLNAFKGGMWGLPHEPHHHIKHDPNTGYLDKRDIGGDYHHHEDHAKFKIGLEKRHWETDYLDVHKYRNMRCYRSMTANGYLNIISTIICPPLGLFMAYGLSGIGKIILCAILTLYYYIPGLVYAVLLTSELGLGLQLKIHDCGGPTGGLNVKGCETRKTEGLCKDASIPDRRGKNGALIPACIWSPDINHKYGGKCENSMIRDDYYTDMINGSLVVSEMEDKDRKNLKAGEAMRNRNPKNVLK